MNQQLILESSPAFVILCVLAGLGYGYLLYTRKHPWSKNLNRLFFLLRSAMVFLLAFLLLGPIIKQTANLFEKPVFIVLHDDSSSIKEASDSSTLKTVSNQISATQNALTEKGYEVKTINLLGQDIKKVEYNAASSDLNAALKNISNRYEGKNIGGIILLSDGIYNAGLSPLYASYNFPVYTVGLGDTSQRVDLSIKNMAYNKIAYQGNKFPLHVEVLVSGLANEGVNISILHHGKVLHQQSKNSGNNLLVAFDFQIPADEQGIQKLDIQVGVNPKEYNVKNNHASIFVEVVEGKKKILLVAPFPHPDIKAIREVVEKNANYEFLMHLPGLSEQPQKILQPGQIDLAIFYQSPDLSGRTKELFQQFANSKTSLFLVLGQQSDLTQIVKNKMPLKLFSQPREYDDVTPAINSGFSNFLLTPENSTIVGNYPPVSVHFGKIQVPLSATPLLFQRVGSVTTDKPLLAIENGDEHKIAILLGEGIWRWRMNEFDLTENTMAFDELFGKLFQYLSTTDDKRKFRSYPVQQEFSDTEPVIFESQIYNDIFEPVYGNSIDISIIDEAGKKTQYTYVTNPSNTRYQIGGLKEGVYRFLSKTLLNGKSEQVKGEFIVVSRKAELQNLTADFDLLRKLSANTGGKFYTAPNIRKLTSELEKTQAKSIIHSEEQYQSLINLKWFFWILLAIISLEWFLRKFHGSY